MTKQHADDLKLTSHSIDVQADAMQMCYVNPDLASFVISSTGELPIEGMLLPVGQICLQMLTLQQCLALLIPQQLDQA